MMPPLSGRLRLITEMVPACGTCADVGCDHGYAIISLMLSGKVKKGIAMDVRPGPLAAARENTEKYGLAEKLDLRLSDGLASLSPCEADCVVIAGMGGPLTVKILTEGKDRLSPETVLVLEPQSDKEKVRRWLEEEGFLQEKEVYLEEEGKVYSVILAVKSSEKQEKLTPAQLAFGPYALAAKDPVLKEALKDRLRLIRNLKGKLAEAATEKAAARLSELNGEERNIMEALSYYKEEIILASASPRRKQLLETAGFAVRVQASDADESVVHTADPADMVCRLSRIKCESVAETVSEGIVLGADTVVALDGEILGKPKDEKDAERMLSHLSGKNHQVYTGVTLIHRENGETAAADTFYEKTEVFVAPLSEEEIEDYIAGGEPFDKAGAYGIQGGFSRYVTGITGDYANVVGLPVAAVYRHLKELGKKA